MPCFNHARYVEESIFSVLNSTEDDLELIVVDDASTDDSRSVIERAQAKDRRVKAIFHETNKGASEARNSALKIATGEYVAFCDADDLWETIKLENQVALLDRFPHAGIAYGDAEIINDLGAKTGETFSKRFPVPGNGCGDLFATLCLRNFINIQSALVRREFITPENYFDPKLKLVEDWWFWLKLARVTSFIYDPAPLSYYRINSSTLASKNLASNRLTVYERTLSFFPDVTSGNPKKWQSILSGKLGSILPMRSEILYHMGVAFTQCGKPKDARNSFAKALKFNPIHWKAAVRFMLCTVRS